MTVILRDATKAVRLYYGLNGRTLMHGRDYAAAHPRQMAIHVARQLTKLSLPQVGRYFGLDHTTALHAVRAVDQRIQECPKQSADLYALRELTLRLAEQRRAEELAQVQQAIATGQIKPARGISSPVNDNNEAAQQQSI